MGVLQHPLLVAAKESNHVLSSVGLKRAQANTDISPGLSGSCAVCAAEAAEAVTCSTCAKGW